MFGLVSKESLAFCVILVLAVSSYTALSMELFGVRYVENNGARLIATSNYNYGLSSPALASRNWRTASVNGQTIVAVTLAGQDVVLTQSIGQDDRLFLDNLRDEIASQNNGGFMQMSNGEGSSFSGESMMMSSSLGSAGTSFSSSSSSGGMSSSSMMGANNGMSVNMRGENDFSVSSNNLPFNWSRIYVNGDLVTFVSRNGEVEMRPLSSLDKAKAEALARIRQDVKAFNAAQTQQFANTMQGSMNMVSNIFNSIMGSMPRPPDYNSAMGGMFGNNFPFGPNNNPFSAAAGWPFSGGAFAFAG